MPSALQHLGELWRHRSLVSTLTARELKGRYRGSILGFFWTFLNPLLLLLVYALVFSVYFRFDMEHYSVFMFSGLLPWMFFSQALMEGTGAVVDAGSLVSKVLFPMQILPAVKVMSNFINYLLTIPILLLFLAASHIYPSVHLIAFPVIAAIHLLFTYALTLILCTACVFMRDTRHILGNLLTLWFFLTPILYPLSQVPPRFHPLIYLNPAALFTIAYQDIFFWRHWPKWDALAVLALASIILTLISIKIFDSYKEYFAEKV